MTERLTQSHELERKPPLIAEIGTGGLNIGYDISRIPEGFTVVTIDLLQGVGASDNYHDATKVEGLYAKRAEELQARGEPVSEFRHLPVFADGREAPFKDETFDYVLLSNVISDPGISASDAAKLIEEALRLVKDQGAVILREDLSPSIAEDRFARTNGETHDIFHIITLEDKLWREGRKVNAFVDKSLSPDIRILKKSDNLGKVPLEMYDLSETEAR